MPHRSIHGKEAAFWNSAVPVEKVQKSGSESASAASVVASAVQRTLRSGPTRHATAPVSGTANSRVRIQWVP